MDLTGQSWPVKEAGNDAGEDYTSCTLGCEHGYSSNIQEKRSVKSQGNVYYHVSCDDTMRLYNFLMDIDSDLFGRPATFEDLKGYMTVEDFQKYDANGDGGMLGDELRAWWLALIESGNTDLIGILQFDKPDSIAVKCLDTKLQCNAPAEDLNCSPDDCTPAFTEEEELASRGTRKHCPNGGLVVGTTNGCKCDYKETIQTQTETASSSASSVSGFTHLARLAVLGIIALL
jgi:hypothetical protein